MNIFPIKNDADNQTALAEIDKLMNAEIKTTEGDALDIWVTLVESYEAKQFPISAPHCMFQRTNP
jgi:HTH-type transcriptional regulator / antitoxin HigA